MLSGGVVGLIGMGMVVNDRAAAKAARSPDGGGVDWYGEGEVGRSMASAGLAAAWLPQSEDRGWCQRGVVGLMGTGGCGG